MGEITESLIRTENMDLQEEKHNFLNRMTSILGDHPMASPAHGIEKQKNFKNLKIQIHRPLGILYWILGWNSWLLG